MASRFVLPYAEIGAGISPSDGAKLYFYASGTSTAKDTFSDSAATVANPNPMVADSTGRFGDIFVVGTYKVVLKDKNGVQIWTADPYTGPAESQNFSTKADLAAAVLTAGTTAETRGYYDGWAAFAEPKGAGQYDIALLSDVRTAKSDGSWVPDGYVNFYIGNAGNTHVAMLKTDGQISLFQGGAKGDNSTDDTDAVDATVNSGFKDIYVPSAIFRLFRKITVAVSTGMHIHGAGVLESQFRVIDGTFDVFEFDDTASQITGLSVSNLTIRHLGTADRTGGSFITFTEKRPINSVFHNLDMRGHWIGLNMRAAARCKIDNCNFNQSGRTTTKAHASIVFGANLSNHPTDNHVDNCQITGITTLDPASVSGILLNSSDGLYITNTHIYQCDYDLRVEPNATALDQTVASILCSNVYFDTAEISHVAFFSQGSTAYRNFQFSNCQFRDTKTSHSVHFNPTAGDIDYVSFTGCTFRDNYKSAIHAAGSPNNCQHLVVSGCVFKGNNVENATVQGDIITRGNYAVITGNSFSAGGANGHAVRFLSGATNNTVAACDFSQSTATDVLNDGGTGTRLYALQGFVIDNKGSATINNPSTSIVVAHGLDVTPSQFDIRLTPINNLAANGVDAYWVDSVDATNFTINVNAAPSTNAQFAWDVKSNT